MIRRVDVDYLVVGAGAMGMGFTDALIDHAPQVRVALVDRHDPGRATDAGAGILSPESSSNPDPSWFALAMGAGEHYRRLVPVLERDGGRVTGYAVTGLLRVRFREWEYDLFAANLALARARVPDAVEEITPAEATRRFPPLGAMRAAWYSARAAHVDGRSMTAALLDAAVARGVAVVAGSVDELRTTHRVVRAVALADGSEVAGDAVVVAGGAWSPAIGDRLGVRLPIVPVRGQIVHFRLDDVDTAGWPIV